MNILHRITPWHYLGLALVLSLVSLGALRANNQRMVDLRDAVVAADKKGEGVSQALQALQAHVTAHMNTKLTTRDGVYPPVQLKYTYDRLVVAEGEKVAQQNKAQYDDAVAHCPSSGGSYDANLAQQNCVVAYMQDKHNLNAGSIPDSLYKFDFVSPAWSPDLAGWSIVATVVSFGLFVVFLVKDFWFKKVLA